MAADEDKDIAATDRAYQAAAEAVPVKASKPVSVKAKASKPKEAGAEAEPKPGKIEAPVIASPAVEEVVPVVPAPQLAKEPKAEKLPKVRKQAQQRRALGTSAKPQPLAGAKAPIRAKAKPVAKVVPVKAATPKPAATVAGETVRPKAPGVRPAAAPSRAAKTAPANTIAGLFTQFMLEDKTMDMSGNFSGFQDTITDAQAKAKDAFEKSTKMLGEVGDFTKGNVEAVIEAGKILAEGVQSLGSDLAAEGRTAFEAMSGDIKELAAAKSPTDFFKIQSDMMRKNFDSAVAYGSKNSEAMLKLVSDAMAPISGRVSIAMEKARSASL